MHSNYRSKWPNVSIGSCMPFLLERFSRQLAQRRRKRDAKVSGRLKVQHEIELAGQLDGELAGLGASDDLCTK